MNRIMGLLYVTFYRVLMSKDDRVVSHPHECADYEDFLQFILFSIQGQAVLVQPFIFKNEIVLILSFPIISAKQIIYGNILDINIEGR